MSIAAADFIDLYVFTPGRILYSVAEVKKRAEERGLKAISSACDKSLESAQQNLDAENAWERTKNAPTARGEGEAKAIDPSLDRAVSGLQDSVATLLRSLSPENGLVRVGKEFLRKAFPSGAAAITSLPYEDELAAVKDLLRRMADPADLQPLAVKLSLQPYIDELEKLAESFEKALRSASELEVSYGEVKASRSAAQDWFLALVLRIGGLYSDPIPEHADGRSYLLEPIMDQNERIAAVRRRRQRVTDVDPDTGEEQLLQPIEPSHPTATYPIVREP